MSAYAGQTIIAESADHVAEVIRGCVSTSVPFAVTGGDRLVTQRDNRCVLSMARLTGIIEHEVQDLTVTVQPGITAAALMSLVGAKGQRLALECAHPEERTIGGLYSAAVDGFCADALGSFRDQVLGLHAVLPDGRCIRAGGRVVKNVTGYDLGKLFWGARGSLGVITEMTLRLRAQPRAERTITSTHDDIGSCFALALELRELSCRVTGLVVSRDPDGRWTLSARLEGRPGTLDVVTAPLVDAGLSPSEGMWSTLAEQAERGRRRAVVRTPVEGLAEAMRLASSRTSDDAILIADVARGILFIGLEGDGPSVPDALELPTRPDWRIRVPDAPLLEAPDAGRTILLQRIRAAFAPTDQAGATR